MLTMIFIKQMVEAAGYKVDVTEEQVSGAIDAMLVFGAAIFAFFKDQRIKACGSEK